MGTELKTLKDFDWKEYDAYNDSEDLLKDLKLEAIKWIDQDSIQELFLSGRVDLLPEFREILGDGIKSWIKHFFNLDDALVGGGVA